MCMKDAEVLRNDRIVVRKLRRRAVEHAAPGVENDGLVGDLERELEVLLDQDDGLPLFLEALMVRPTSATISGARPSEGSSSSSTRGLPISARPIASI